MCYAKPGPRCSAHAKAALVKAQEDNVEAFTQYQTIGISIIDPQEIDKVVDTYGKSCVALEKAQEDYEETAAFEKEVKDYEEQLKNPLSTLPPYWVGVQKERMIAGQKRREQKKHNLFLHQRAQMNLSSPEHQENLEQGRQKVEKFQWLEDHARSSVEHYSEKVEKLQGAVFSAKYELQGALARDPRNTVLANNPGLWTGNMDVYRMPEYQKLEQVRNELDQAKTNLQRSQQTLHGSRIQNIKTRDSFNNFQRRISTPFHENGYYEGYGQTKLMPDSSTNALYPTQIPGTDTEIYARVMRVDSQHIVLETGQSVPHQKVNKSAFIYENIGEDAAFGPKLYRVDSR